MDLTFPDGQPVPVLGQGTWYMGDAAPRRKDELEALRTGLDLGLTVIDTAEMYGSGNAEELVGEAVEGRRAEAFLISKVLPHNASRHGTVAACERSLKRLKTDYIDLYLLHWQGPYPFEDTVEAMLELTAAGKIRYWGVSNMDVEEMEKFFALPDGPTCAANEILYNLSRRGIEYDLIPWCTDHRLPMIAYSPLEQDRILSHPALKAVAGRHQATSSQVALAWILRVPGMMAIPKAATAAHVEQNAAALSLSLTPDDLADLDKAFPAPAGKQPLEMI